MVCQDDFERLPGRRGYGVVFRDKSLLPAFRAVDWGGVAFLSTNSAYNLRRSQILAMVEKIENTQPIKVDLAITEQKQKEDKNNVWNESVFRDLPKLKTNNTGNVGEVFVRSICEQNNIAVSIDGTKTKMRGGGCGDGFINGKTVEIKTAHLGVGGTFQHELGEHPWRPEYILLVDVAPHEAYFTIIKNFSKDHYQLRQNCGPCFPSKVITRRKQTGNFKFDTTIGLCKRSCGTICITSHTTREVGDFIRTMIL